MKRRMAIPGRSGASYPGSVARRARHSTSVASTRRATRVGVVVKQGGRLCIWSANSRVRGCPPASRMCPCLAGRCPRPPTRRPRCRERGYGRCAPRRPPPPPPDIRCGHRPHRFPAKGSERRHPTASGLDDVHLKLAAAPRHFAVISRQTAASPRSASCNLRSAEMPSTTEARGARREARGGRRRATAPRIPAAWSDVPGPNRPIGWSGGPAPFPMGACGTRLTGWVDSSGDAFVGEGRASVSREPAIARHGAIDDEDPIRSFGFSHPIRIRGVNA